MMYLSQLINKPLYYQEKELGKILDLAVVENRPIPPVSKIVIKSNNKKLTIPPSLIELRGHSLFLKTHDAPFLPYDEKDFYLAEDLLDKQVIDTDGKRLVRVNDVLLESNGELKVMGIDIGISGIFRRLGFSTLNLLLGIKSKTLPWSLIEAFDYQTGAIRLRLTQNRLNTFHPSEIAEILEEVGTKERLGLMETLDAQKAASAIEEVDTQTQLSILEQMPSLHLRDVVNKMLISEIADIFYKINPLRNKEILTLIGQDKAQKVQRLLNYDEDTAGGLMHLVFYQTGGEKTVKEVLKELAEQKQKPEAIIVTNGNEKLVGIIQTKDLINLDHLAVLKDVVSDRKFVFSNTNFSKILELFAEYNLRILPVVDKDKKVIGIVTIDALLSKIKEQKDKNNVL